MRGIRGISEELDRILEPLSSRDLKHVVDVALDLTLDEYGRDPGIPSAIESYRADPVAARALADDLSRLSAVCDSVYIELEDSGKMAESDASFRKMCTLNGLSMLMASPHITPDVVDRLIYDLGHGAADTDLFAKRMIERLR